jgi:IclR family transcriptional regulator, mhp operon transcriptional activator
MAGPAAAASVHVSERHSEMWNAAMSVNSLQKGLEILRLLNELDHTQVRHLHKATGLPKATIVRMIDTLVDAGYVMRSENGDCILTAKVLALSHGYHADDHLLAISGPILERFRQEHSWPTDLARFDQDAMVILDTSRSTGTLSLNRSIGSRLPVMVTALGRAWLGFCEPAERERALAALARSPDPLADLARDRVALDRLVAEIRVRGYAVSDREYLKYTRAVAVPILSGGRVVACINMMVVASAMTMEEAETIFVTPLRAAAEEIAQGLAR